MNDIQISELKLHQKSRILEIIFENDTRFNLPCEYLRVFSPSAEVQGHGQGILQVGKKNINITSIEPVGNYGVKLIFDDGHNTGIYSWTVLYDLAIHQEENWADYLERLKQAGGSR